MTHLTAILDADTKKNWLNIEVELSRRTESAGENIVALRTIMSSMLQEFDASYQQFHITPPGIKETLSLMLPLSLCNNDKDLNAQLAQPTLLDNWEAAIHKVSSIQSGLNYVKAGLRCIAALILSCVIAPLAFISSLILGVLAGSVIPYVGILMLAPLAAIPTFYTYAASKDLFVHGVNQIQRTWHENTSECKIVQQLGLFGSQIDHSLNTSPTANETPIVQPT